MALVRVGANWTPQDPRPDYRYCLDCRPAGLARDHRPGMPRCPRVPEIVLRQVSADGSTSPWPFRHWLLDAGPADQVFTLTPEQYSPVLTSDGTTWLDYDGDGGTTIRFGDGTFGHVSAARHAVQRHLPGGRRLSRERPGRRDHQRRRPASRRGRDHRLHQPFPATGGDDAETIAQIRARAPQQFSAEPLRAVLASDYQAAAQSLPWVQQAAASFRWTGSWLTVLTRPIPPGREEPTIAELECRSPSCSTRSGWPATRATSCRRATSRST